MRLIFKLPENCLKFCKTNKNGQTLKFRWEMLSEGRWQEFVDFNMDYYVKYEITHTVAGIHKQANAIDEYKQILLKQLQDPWILPLYCCIDNNDKGEILATNAIKLFKKGEIYKDVAEAATKEVKRFFKILHEWNQLCPVPDIMIKYNVETYFDDAGLAVHPDYRGFAISKEASTIREFICKENKVPMTGAWHTSVATQKGSQRAGWETVYEICYQDLEKMLDITFEDPPPTFQYKVKKIDS